MGIGPCGAGRGTPTSRPVNSPRNRCLTPQKRTWLTCPLHGCALRHTPKESHWGRAPADINSQAAQRAALQSWQNVNESDKTPADLFQSALSALDLYHPAATSKSEIIDDPDDITVEQGQTAASVGRSIYEILRLNTLGKTRRMYVKRRDLLRANGLQPRDLRRIDPSQGVTKTSPNISIKEHVLVINLGGVRAIIHANKCLLFEPSSASSRKFLDLLCERLRQESAQRHPQHTQSEDDIPDSIEEAKPPPFELEVLEAALMVATGRLDAELTAVSKRVSRVLLNLPRDITPVNLEELRRVKQALVELESKADNLRDMLEELMDDEDEVRDMNLSSRPSREERRRVREREKIERGMERERDRERDFMRGSSVSPLTDSSYTQFEQQHDSNGSTAAESNSRSSKSRNADSRSDGENEYETEAEAALEEMDDAEMEERELEETEDLLEYYLQRAANTQSEAERLLAGARDLEESIGVSLSARRFEVNRLELTLSIGSFSAALGAMVAGIFGMNLRSTLEDSIIGFWGTTAGIVLCCFWVFYALYSYTRRRRIL
ncbi:hypothetical protein CVIRNUC_003034 [Coccomyxa viridis]|uniref:Magnesium transporter n=1 Tax=Coccomyxa viridis TaxID=1274662 RepID=A0AAV1HYH4_9CHLO|nr:hypothetical protein CVIRNUC_003034 [Coccomyxa viridis]